MSLSYITDETPAGTFETINVSTTAIGVTASLLEVGLPGGFHRRAVKLYISNETNSIRVRWDGTAPTASVGHLLTAGDSITIEGEQNCSNFKAIRVSADATLMVTVYYNI